MRFAVYFAFVLFRCFGAANARAFVFFFTFFGLFHSKKKAAQASGRVRMRRCGKMFPDVIGHPQHHRPPSARLPMARGFP